MKDEITADVVVSR